MNLSGRNKAFTLIELMIVIGIIGMLMALIGPAVIGSGVVADQLQCKNNLREIGSGLEFYKSSHGRYPKKDGAEFILELWKKGILTDADYYRCPSDNSTDFDSIFSDEHIAATSKLHAKDLISYAGRMNKKHKIKLGKAGEALAADQGDWGEDPNHEFGINVAFVSGAVKYLLFDEYFDGNNNPIGSLKPLDTLGD